MREIGQGGGLFPLLDKIAKKMTGCRTLESAARVATDALYEEFASTIVLVRLFATVPFDRLPAANRGFVAKLVESQGVADQIKSETMVLSLLGTRGANPSWNDRRRSVGHVGIPLVSAAFIDRIPMMSRLLKEVGLDLNWIDRQNAIAIKTLAGLSGVFYVPDAETAVDHLGRKIISAQKFVCDNKIKTVFGLAGGYPVSGSFLTLIVFCRETILRSDVEQFLPLISSFKAGTTALVQAGAVFG